MSMSHEQAERLLHLLEENLIVMSTLSDNTAALAVAVTDLGTAVAAVPAGGNSGQVTALQAEVATLQADNDAAATAVASATTAVQAATDTLTADEAPPAPPASVPSALTFPTQAIDATVGTPVNSTVTADGGTPPYSYSSTLLPDGLSIDGAGVITGTPTAASGEQTGTVDVTDSTGATASGTVTVTVVA